MFDKVMEGVSLMKKTEGLNKREFKIAAVCLFMAAKLEDPKYPYFDCYVKVLLDKSSGSPAYHDQITSFKNKDEYPSMGEALLDLELFIWGQLNYNLSLPVTMKFYDRFARIAFSGSPEPELDYHLGLYFLYIAAFYPKVQFDFKQSLIAASAVHCVLRLRESDWRWSDYLHLEATCGAYCEDSLRECTLRLIRKYVGLCVNKEKKYKQRLWIVESKFQ